MREPWALDIHATQRRNPTPFWMLPRKGFFGSTAAAEAKCRGCLPLSAQAIQSAASGAPHRDPAPPAQQSGQSPDTASRLCLGTCSAEWGKWDTSSGILSLCLVCPWPSVHGIPRSPCSTSCQVLPHTRVTWGRLEDHPPGGTVDELRPT